MEISDWVPTTHTFPSIEDKLLRILEEDLREEEIKKGVFEMAPQKYPIPDGYHACFF